MRLSTPTVALGLALFQATCSTRVGAFSAPGRRRRNDTRSAAAAAARLSSAPAQTFMYRTGDDGPGDVNDGYRLELDSEGHLRFDFVDGGAVGGGVIFDGLEPTVWTATRPGTDDSGSASSRSSSSLFLHTSHSTEKAERDTTLGNLPSCRRLLACARVTRYWMGPAFGTSAEDLPLDTQFLLVELLASDDEGSGGSSPRGGGPYALILPLIDGTFRASLQYGGRGDEVVCHEESGDDAVVSSGMRALYVAFGDDPFGLLKTGFAQVAEATGSFVTLDGKVLPPSVDEFGWCTWDAFYSEVTPEGVIDGTTSLREAGVPPRTIILDDGWQQVTPMKKTDENMETANSEEVASRVSRIYSVLSRAAGHVLAAFAKVVEAFYESFVRKSRHGSIPNRIWRFLTKTILKGQMWDYFDNETDFGRQLSGFLPNRKFEPAEEEGAGGLKGLVSRLKNQLDVRRVYCWHALHGYWRGVSPDLGREVGINATNIIPRLSRNLLRVEPQLAWDSVSLFGVGLVTNEADLATFYENLHAPLARAGVDGVKVDVQSGVPAVGGGVGGGPHLARIYTEAMEASVSDHFSSEYGARNCINCMCHSTENLYRYKTTSVARASDDFYPRRWNSHTVHLVNVAYNSLFIGEICLPDWDMFHSKHESGPLHAAARAIGGCPVYVSDSPGQHDVTLLKRLALPDGSVLRSKLPGRPTRDCLFADVGTDGTSALKVWNKNSYGGVVGAFHVQGVAWSFDTHENQVIDAAPQPLTALVKPHDVETMRDVAGPFVAWRHQSSKIEFLPTGESTVEVRLHPREWEICTIMPVQSINDSNRVRWAPIGLADMLNSGGALLKVGRLEQSGPKTDVSFSSRGPGRFVAYCQPAPSQLLVDKGDGKPSSLPFSHDEPSGLLDFVLPSERSGPHQVRVVWE